METLKIRGRQGPVLEGQARDLLSRLGIRAANRRDIPGAGHEVDDGVQKGLDPLVPQGGTAQDRHQRQRGGRLSDRRDKLGFGDLLLCQIGLHERIVCLGQGFEQRFPVGFGLFQEIGGDLCLVKGGPQVLVMPGDLLHANQVDHAGEGVFEAHRKLQQQRAGVEPLLQHIDGAEKSRRRSGPFC